MKRIARAFRNHYLAEPWNLPETGLTFYGFVKTLECVFTGFLLVIVLIFLLCWFAPNNGQEPYALKEFKKEMKQDSIKFARWKN